MEAGLDSQDGMRGYQNKNHKVYLKLIKLKADIMFSRKKKLDPHSKR
jgi:hypothetical protein